MCVCPHPRRACSKRECTWRRPYLPEARRLRRAGSDADAGSTLRARARAARAPHSARQQHFLLPEVSAASGSGSAVSPLPDCASVFRILLLTSLRATSVNRLFTPVLDFALVS